MSKITVQLNQDYKSFKLSQKPIDLIGDLIILTGSNGSGKSQFLEIIGKEFFTNKLGQSEFLQKVVSINDGPGLNGGNILLKSFKDSLVPASLAGQNNRQTLEQTAWSWFVQNSNANTWNGYSKCREDLQNYFISKGLQYYGLTDQIQFNKNLPDDFTLYPDDKFSSGVYSLFQNYLWKVYINSSIKGGMTHFSPSIIPETKPWEDLNVLFEDLGFSYRFKEPRIKPNQELEEIPLLWGFSNGQFTDLNLETNELSDGEKAIFSLAVSSIGQIGNIKFLLLDEYDATFNPTLTEWYYKIINKFYLQKDVTVILTTHNPITATFAPVNIQDKQTTFYEVSKYDAQGDRFSLKILAEVQDMKKVLKQFYPQVEELEKEIVTRRNQIEELKNNKLPNKSTPQQSNGVLLQLQTRLLKKSFCFGWFLCV
jgi:ABC-type lipoprotein export system ATPase subunit